MNNRNTSGWHLILEALVEDPSLLKDEQALTRVMTDLVGVLRMKPLAPPRCWQVPLDEGLLASEQDEGGITGFCVITTSHISIHTWPLRRRFSMDVFSCRPFDEGAALQFIADRLRVSAMNATWVERTWPSAGPAVVRQLDAQGKDRKTEGTSQAA
jgi:S-adenosylmethionine/arginine decarboxylase-like enzyme